MRNQVNLEEFELKNLLQLQGSIVDELKRRKIIRTRNNPLGDYTEWLVARALDLELATNSNAGYDAISKEGIRVQIKGRRISLSNKSRQLSTIRKYEEKDFDELAAVIFDENFNILEAVLIPHEVVGEYASYRKHVNGHILYIKGPILTDPRIKCIKQIISD